MRLDKFLKVSRLIKRRTVANEACDAGRVMVNDKPAKASAQVKAGDIIEIQFGSRNVKVEVLDVKETVKKEDVENLYRYLEQTFISHPTGKNRPGLFFSEKAYTDIKDTFRRAFLEGKNENMPHKLTFENRTSGTITGVRDVTSFDEKEILLLTTQGKLKLKGEQMHVKRLDLKQGEVEVEGKLEEAVYQSGNNLKKEEPLLKRVFR